MAGEVDHQGNLLGKLDVPSRDCIDFRKVESLAKCRVHVLPNMSRDS
jgi:hypothetical protein